MLQLKNDQQILAGNFVISVGTHHTTEIAVFSKSTGDIVSFKCLKHSKKFRSVKRKFKANLCSEKSFYFSHMQPDQVEQLVKMLKK